MNAIETMMQEHRLIERVLDSLEAYARALYRGESVERSDLSRFVEFVRGYADAKHHRKEEGVLFIVMIEHGFSRETCPLAVMYRDHDAGRTHVRHLANIADKKAWSSDDKRELVTKVRELVALLREHIMKEDNVLYPLARAKLPASAMAEVEKRCAELERLQLEDGSQERLEKLGRELSSKYGGASAPADGSGSSPVSLPISPTPLIS